jgi:dinuclear metal center YbgI/SA1388 family protein
VSGRDPETYRSTRATQLRDLVAALDRIAPLRLAEPWDNVGLLVGDPSANVTRALVTIDCTREVAEEARRRECELVIAYHPTIFAPLKRIAHDGPVAFALAHGMAIYSPHTALDAAQGGTNDVLAGVAGLEDRRPLRVATGEADDSSLGMGRIGTVSTDRSALIERVRRRLQVERLLVAGPDAGPAKCCAVVAGAPGDLLFAAIAAGADVIVTGEVRHHDALAAAAKGVTVICALHSQSERVALDAYGARIRQEAPGLEIVRSELDRDPFVIV